MRQAIRHIQRYLRDSNAFQLQQPSRASLWAGLLVFVLVFSLVPKWASLHLASILIIGTLFRMRREDWRRPAVRTYLLFVSLWMLPFSLAIVAQHLTGLATATEPVEALKLWLRTYGVGLGLILFLERDWLSLRSLSLLILFALSLHAGIGLYEFLSQPGAGLSQWRGVRLMGLAKNPNPFGLFMALGAVLALALWKQQNFAENKRTWTGLLLLFALFAFGALGSGSRGALLAMLAGVVVLLPPLSVNRLILYALTLGLLVTWFLAGGGISAAAISDSLRIQALQFSLQAFLQSPWYGWGYDIYMEIPGHVGVNAPHNMWLDAALSGGILTLLGLLLCCILLGYRLLRKKHSILTQAILAFLALYLVSGTLEGSVLASTHWRGAWVLILSVSCFALVQGKTPNVVQERM